MSAHLRPTSDRVRESIFNLLQNGGYGDCVAESRVLDLFAGTGALGLEALSRGAASAVFVDDGAKAIGLLRENISICQAQGVTRVFRHDAMRLGENRGDTFDLVFLDPPYGKILGERALNSAKAGGWLAEGAMVVFEESKAIAPPADFECLDQRSYGDTWISLLRLM